VVDTWVLYKWVLLATLRAGLISDEPSCSGVNASSRMGMKCQRGWDVGRGCPLPRFFFVMSKWHILVFSEVLRLKYVMILVEMFPLTSPKPKYWRGCVPGIPGGVDASGPTHSTTTGLL